MRNKYYKQELFISHDGGETWTSVGAFQKGALIEVGGDDCSPQMRMNSGTPYCVGYDKYYDKIIEVSYDKGETWEFYSSAATLVEINSTDCGYAPIIPLHRDTISGSPFCFDGDKMAKVINQVSYDNGETWEDTGWSIVLIEKDSPDCRYVPPTPPIYRWVQTTTTICIEDSTPLSGQYLTLIASDDITVTFTPQNSNVLYYSKDNGTTWTEGNSIEVFASEEVFLKGEMTPSFLNGIGKFSSNGSFEALGNPMSLLFGDNFSSQTSLAGKDDAFGTLFSGCTYLESIENLVLPATTLAERCYVNMFRGCTSLTSIPSGFLPATTLAEGCYYGMFQGCTSLASVPSGLLLTTTLSINCYNHMFYGCTSLTTAPALQATTLTQSCYNSMFQGCTSLTTAPVLSASTLTNNCYEAMFQGCTNLNYIKCMATDISDSSCTYNWVDGVASSGTFIRDCNTNWSRGASGIPNNWQDNCSTPQYRTTSGTPYCQGFDKYVDVYSQVSYDSGETWTTTATTATLIEHNSEDCGYIAPQYRTTSGTPYCSGYDKYVDVYSQVSYDSGSTWTTTATTPTLIEADSPDCGYVPSSFELASYIREAHYISDTLTGTIYGTNGFSASFEHSSVSATQTLVDNIEGTLSTYGYVMNSNYNTIEPYKAITKTITITTIEGIRYTITLNIGKGLKGQLTTLKN